MRKKGRKVMAKQKQSVFFCKECGYESAKWMGQCPGCGAWGSFSEEPVVKVKQQSGMGRAVSAPKAKPRRIQDVSAEEEPRFSSGFAEMDRVLGGGVVRGSLILVGGDPGIGKSTLLLQSCKMISEQGKKVLYVSGEESARQIRMRADRIGTFTGSLELLAETNLDVIEGAIAETKPDVAVIDSIQTMYREDVASAQGSVSQVRESTNSLLKVAKEQNITMSELNPKRLLKGATPRLIDEWQLAPKLWDAIRFEVDHRGELGQFVLTGSAVPADTREITHSGTGRFTWLTMRPMSLYESGDSTGEVSMKDLFEGAMEIDGAANLSIDRLAFLVCRGGWPQAVDMRDEIALDQATDYYDAVVHSDINRADNVQKNPERVSRLMRSYARNQGGQVPDTVLAQDIAVNDGMPINEETVASYVSALRKIFVVEDMPAWNPNLRSKTAIRSSDTRYYVDPSIAAAALGIGPNDLLNDLKTFGFLFEALCIRDLRVYADALNGKVYHYRDKDGQ